MTTNHQLVWGSIFSHDNQLLITWYWELLCSHHGIFCCVGRFGLMTAEKERNVEYSGPHSIGACDGGQLEAECRITQQDCCKVVCGSVFPSEPEANTWVYFPKSGLCHGDQPWDPDGLIKTKLCTAHNPQKQRLVDKSNITLFKKMHTIDKIHAFEIVRVIPS